MAHDLERLKQRITLLEYLQRHNWKPCRAGTRQELIGLCPLHQEVRPSFYVNAHKNLFYCHGCGRGGDLIRFVQLFLNLPFRQSVAHLEQELMPAPASQLLEQTLAFYQLQLHRHSEAVRYLEYRGLHDPTIIEGPRHRVCARRKLAAPPRRLGISIRSAVRHRPDQQARP
jgi:DNA primase